MLREQLQQLTRQKLQAHMIPEEADDDERGDGEGAEPTLSLCTRTGKMAVGASENPHGASWRARTCARS